jgi:hypothetical protein
VGQDPEELRAEIARTRAELGQDLDVLVEKVTPSKVVERKVDATKEAVVGVKEKIMGSAASAKQSVMGSAGSATSSAGGTLSGAGHGVASSVSSTGHSVAGSVSSAGSTVAGSVSSAGHTVADAAAQAPATVKQKASGNPFAAGVVAFGLGWLVSSLLPASKVEQQGADKLKEAAQAVAEPVKQGLDVRGQRGEGEPRPGRAGGRAGRQAGGHRRRLHRQGAGGPGPVAGQGPGHHVGEHGQGHRGQRRAGRQGAGHQPERSPAARR